MRDPCVPTPRLGRAADQRATMRGTWLVALPLLLAAFTVGRPQPPPPPTLPPSFDRSTRRRARARTGARLSRPRTPARPARCGGLGRGAARPLRLPAAGRPLPGNASRVSATSSRRTSSRWYEASRRGRSSSRRTADNSGEGRGTNDNASGTAALIEPRASVRPGAAGASAPGRRSRRTRSSSSRPTAAHFGSLGAARFAERSPYGRDALAVVSLDAVAGMGAPGSSSAAIPRVRRRQRLSVRLRGPGARADGGRAGPRVGVASVARSRLPVHARRAGAVRPGGRSGGDPDDPAGRSERGFVDDPLSVERLGDLGRAAQATIGRLDPGLELAQGTTSYVYLGARIVRGWAIQLVLLTALLPFLIEPSIFVGAAAPDQAGPAARSLRSRIAFWAYAGLLVLVAARPRRLPGRRGAAAAARRRRTSPHPSCSGARGASWPAGSSRDSRSSPADRPGSRRPWPATPSLCSRSP